MCDDFRFNVDGIMLSVHELKPGMAGRPIHPGHQVRLSLGLWVERPRGCDEKGVMGLADARDFETRP